MLIEYKDIAKLSYIVMPKLTKCKFPIGGCLFHFDGKYLQVILCTDWMLKCQTIGKDFISDCGCNLSDIQHIQTNDKYINIQNVNNNIQINNTVYKPTQFNIKNVVNIYKYVTTLVYDKFIHIEKQKLKSMLDKYKYKSKSSIIYFCNNKFKIKPLPLAIGLPYGIWKHIYTYYTPKNSRITLDIGNHNVIKIFQNKQTWYIIPELKMKGD